VTGSPATGSESLDLPEVLARGTDAPPLRDGAGQSASRRVHELPPPPRDGQQPGLSGSRLLDIEAGPSHDWAPRGRVSGWLLSALFHAGLLVVLALAIESSRVSTRFDGVIASIDAPEPLLTSEMLAEEWVVTQPDRDDGTAAEVDLACEVPELDEPGPEEPGSPRDAPQQGAEALVVGIGPQEQIDWLLPSDRPVGGGLDGRKREARAALVTSGGGTPQSESAVERGLRWLVAHQRDDGSWHFNHRNELYRGAECRNPGTEPSTTAATGMVLLPLLGAGYTHREGQYQQAVQRGLYYLMQRALLSDRGHDLRQGTMYAQRLATIALCEAYAMTGDGQLRPFAQGGIDFLCYAQDTKGGGWRYTPGEPGDTTVTGWQLMALKSGQMAGLKVPTPTIFLAKRFLDGVQSDYGSQYGYMDPRPRETTTAIGLLMRMYTGWPRSHPELGRGVRHLSKWGPSEDNMYYNYYATQVMHHFGGPHWEAWNEKMREHLIETQSRRGLENGSWYFSGGHGEKGGRLYNTAMAVMTLEVYYRYMPLYGRELFETSF